MAAIQLLKGPNVASVFGLPQPFADGLHLFVKEKIFPSSANLVIFILASILKFLLDLVSWCTLPFEGIVYSDVNVGVLYNLAIYSWGPGIL